MAKKNLQPSHFLNRELGLLEFNRRVLAQAVDDAVPLLERLRFLTIVSSNLDEFFEIRVAGLKEQIKAGIKESGPDGRSPAEVYELVSAQARVLVGEQYRLLNSVLFPALAKQGDRRIAFRIESGKAVATPVQVGRGDASHTEVLRWQPAGSPATWHDFIGTERFASRALGLSDGQAVQAADAAK